MPFFSMPSKSCQAQWISVTYIRYIFWMVSIALDKILPRQRIPYIENLRLPLTRLLVVVEMVRLSQRVAHDCREEFIIIHYDLAIANPALQIQVSEDPTYNNIFICFGPFHIELAYFGALGHFLDCSGSPHKFTETEVLAPGPLNGFLHGKCFNR